MDWHPPRRLLTVRSALVAGAILLLAEVALGFWLSRQGVSVRAFWGALAGLVGLALLGGILWWLWGYWSLRYHLDRNALTIRWAGSRQVIPLRAIVSVEQGAAAGPSPRWHPLRGAGYWVGPVQTAAGEMVHCFATLPLEEQSLVRTAQGTWGISPKEPEEFLQRLEAEQRLGPTRQVPLARTWTGLWGWAVWRDRWVWVLWGAALLGSLAFFGLCAAWQPGLSLAGRRLVPLGAPTIALAVLAVNGVLGVGASPRDRRTAYLLWGGAAWVQWAGAIIAWLVASQ